MSGWRRESPAGLLVLHHGRGADEHDLLELGDVLDPQRRLQVVTPRVGRPDSHTFHAAYRRLAAFHDELWQRISMGSGSLRPVVDTVSGSRRSVGVRTAGGQAAQGRSDPVPRQRYIQALPRQGTPVARRVRKATGLTR